MLTANHEKTAVILQPSPNVQTCDNEWTDTTVKHSHAVSRGPVFELLSESYNRGLASHLMVLAPIAVMLRQQRNIKLSFENTAFNFQIGIVYKCSWCDLFEQNTLIANVPNRVEINLLQEQRHLRTVVSNVMQPEDTVRDWHAVLTDLCRPRQHIMSKVSTLSKQLNIPQTVCVYFRGTDKKKEVTRVEYTAMFEKLKQMGSHQDPIWLQSDESEFITNMTQMIQQEWPGRKIHTLPNSTYAVNGTPVHQARECDINDAEEILCVILLMAQSKLIVSTMSNVLMAAISYRGTNDGVFVVLSPK